MNKYNIQYPLSSDDIIRLCPGSNIIEYSEIYKINDINDLFGKNGICFILYLTKAQFGHWTVLFKQNDCLSFFDSYGYQPDDEFSFIKPEMRVKYHQVLPHLLMLMKDLKVEYNNYKLQKKNANTCGRHCVVRVWNRHLDCDKYVDIVFKPVENMYDPDQVVTILTNPEL